MTSLKHFYRSLCSITEYDDIIITIIDIGNGISYRSINTKIIFKFQDKHQWRWSVDKAAARLFFAIIRWTFPLLCQTGITKNFRLLYLLTFICTIASKAIFFVSKLVTHRENPGVPVGLSALRFTTPRWIWKIE